MNRVKVLLFATLRDYVGERSVVVEIPSGTTIGGLMDKLVLDHPRLEKVRGAMITAVNRVYADESLVVPENAEVAFFPPVSGG